MNDYLKDFISLEERKVSSLIICLLIGFIYSLYSYHIHGDIGDNLLRLIELLIYSVAGLNVANCIGNIMKTKKEFDDVGKEVGNINKEVSNSK